MRVSELITKLKTLYPQSYPNAEAVKEWSAIAQANLTQFEGSVLRAAFNELMGAWTNGYSPRPADFQTLCAMKSSALVESGSKGFNMRRFSAEVAKLKPRLVTEWFSQNSEMVDGWLAERPDLDPAVERFALRERIEAQAHDVAQAQAANRSVTITGGPAYIHFGREELDEMRASRDRWNEMLAKDSRKTNLGSVMGKALRKSPFDMGGEPAREIVG